MMRDDIPAYGFKHIEAKWGQRFLEGGFQPRRRSRKGKYYVLEMFPYPSGKIHMGHVRNYAIGDVVARFKAMQGHDVLHPIGWDAFGLPAENASIEQGIHPAKWTFANIDAMRSQLTRLGFSYNWKEEICTADPAYYLWGQWFFLKMFEKGLTYKKKSAVNWCPRCHTVLANEQVVDGACWRHSETTVEQKQLDQWYFRITDYAEELLAGCETLAGQWPERVLIMQKNWIGRSRGVLIHFKHGDEDFPVFTTRPDTIFGVTYMAIAFDHPHLSRYIDGSVDEDALQLFLAQCDKVDQTANYRKEGFFTGTQITHPFTGKPLPLYVANFVLAAYGTGAVMAVPAHDQRDFEFAREYDLPVALVIQPPGETLEGKSMTEAYTGDGDLVNSGEFTGLSNRKAIESIIEKLRRQSLGKATIRYKLKDWLISRQRYWGNPIPIVYCEDCGMVAVPEAELPVKLPMDVNITGQGNPLETCETFIHTSCPKCGRSGRRETDTMDTFTCSSWYFLRYTDPFNNKEAFSKEQADKWMPVDQYVGGIEHACMHLLYARFFHKALRDMGFIRSDEPFGRLLTQGMVVSPSHYDPVKKIYYSASELKDKATTLDAKKTLITRIEKMSKLRKNGVDPDRMVDEYGADTVRLFILFAAPPEKDLEWNEKGMEGCFRFIQRVWRWTHRLLAVKVPDGGNGEALSSEGEKARSSLHKTIQKVTEDIGERVQFNTAIAALMEFINHVYNYEASNRADAFLAREMVETTLLLLNPLAPFFTEELAERAGRKDLLCESSWPAANPDYTRDNRLTVVYQINGRVRAEEEVDSGLSRESLLARARENHSIQKWIADKEIAKEIVVPDKLVNLVVKN